MSRRRRRIKIIATLGPASAEREVVAALFQAGADVFRINMSHASHDGMRERVALIRSLEEEFDRPIGILVDLQGPKLRVGIFANGAEDLRKGDVFTLDADPTPGDATRVNLPHPEILGSVQPGHRVLIDDGKVLLRVAAVSPGRAECLVEVAGKISNKKGVSLPDTTIPTSAMTEKDRADLDAALEENIDWIALSFVQRPEDVDRGQEHRRQTRLGARQDRETAGDRLPRGDHRRFRRADGRARRPRRGNAARARARPAEEHHPHGAPGRQAGRRRDADAGIDDHDAGADARGSFRRRDRGVRGRGRDHAVGGKRVRTISQAKPSRR